MGRGRGGVARRQRRLPARRGHVRALARLGVARRPGGPVRGRDDRLRPARRIGILGGLVDQGGILAMAAVLVLLGARRNFGVVGGSALLVASVPEAVRSEIEGIGDVAMSLAAAVGAPGAVSSPESPTTARCRSSSPAALAALWPFRCAPSRPDGARVRPSSFDVKARGSARRCGGKSDEKRYRRRKGRPRSRRCRSTSWSATPHERRNGTPGRSERVSGAASPRPEAVFW
jgi:hypothetical protein